MNLWSNLFPLDTDFVSSGAEAIRNLKTDIRERLSETHCMNGILDTDLKNCDGRHGQFMLYKYSTKSDAGTALSGCCLLAAVGDDILFGGEVL